MTKQDGIIIGFIVGIALVGSFAGVASSSHAKTQNAILHSLCKAGERKIFHCPIGRRMASVCEGSSSPTAQYRFGRSDNIEFTYPNAGEGLTWARTGYSGGGELQINFRNGAHRYVLYSRIIRTGFAPEGNNPKSETGVAVIRRNKLLSDRRCNDPDKEAFVGEVEKVMPEGEFTKWWDLDR